MKSYTIHPVECPIQMNVMDIMATPPPPKTTDAWSARLLRSTMSWRSNSYYQGIIPGGCHQSARRTGGVLMGC